MKNKILIVEDDIGIAEVEKDYLEAYEMEVDIITDGEKGLEAAINNDYNLIILDLMLPGIDGFNICREIRKEKDIPIIVVSAKTSDIDKVRGFGLGLDDYMTKPFSPNELVARVKGHITRYNILKNSSTAAEDKEDKIILKNLIINRTTRQVLLNNKEISLTVTEYDLLNLLASNPNRVFTKNFIFEKIWGYDSDKDIPTITVHMRNLREKIEKNPSEPEHIITVWGVGYKFVE
ncbi:response regulator transcription factor [Oceanirhabdus sp. W0125-5]|uniref:response regulator transcription factor n=1 Tax=Oceanirhabdus sp. W0125-5 TaxID=2999116 RepID=UPI0022F2D042|nr:response regulator transcription factor [Oceanirhabdus sp. W0125-5]WBW96789.1 response regulator transcription factor [Oceanirhabdus sp. W0125-5]